MTADVAGSAARSAGWWQRNRSLLGVVVVVLVVVAFVASVSQRGGRTGALDPENPGPSGAQAVTRVLEQHGVATMVARSEHAFAGVPLGPRTTVMVTSTGNLGRATSRQLATHSAAAGHLVVVAPPTETLQSLRLPLQAVSVSGPDRRCAIPLLAGLRPATESTVGYRTGESAVCAVSGRHGAAYASIVSSGRTTVVGAFDVFRNDTVLRGDNAAIALRLLGQGSRLVWYVPDAADIPVGDGGSVSSLLPRWLGPALLLALGAVLALLLWQGRRLGPVVAEPLPVVVKAAESARSRGRLYRRSRDRDHAASILRRDTAARLAVALHLPRGGDIDQVVVEAGRRTGRDPAQVRAQLMGSSVPDDAALVRLASDLAGLEKEVADS